MKKSNFGVLFLLLLSTNIAWATDLALEYKTQIKENFPVFEEAIGCRFGFKKVIDNRQNKQTLGARFKNPIMSVGVDSWINSAIADITGNEFLPQSGSGALPVQIEPQLMRLYSYSEGLNIQAVIALKLNFLVGDEIAEVRRYRGLGSKTNWAGGVSEYHTAINIAAANMLPNLVGDLPGVCRVLVNGSGNVNRAVLAENQPASQGNETVVETLETEGAGLPLNNPETQPANIESAAIENDNSNQPQYSDLDISGRYISEIKDGGFWGFKGRHSKMEFNLTQHEDHIAITNVSPEVKITAIRVGDKIKFSIGKAKATCGCSFVDGEWQISGNGTTMNGTWKSSGGGLGAWNIRKLY